MKHGGLPTEDDYGGYLGQVSKLLDCKYFIDNIHMSICVIKINFLIVSVEYHISKLKINFKNCFQLFFCLGRLLSHK